MMPHVSVWCAQAFQDGLKQCEAMVAQSRAGLRRKECVLATGPWQGMATIPHANGSGAAAGPPADPKPRTQTGSQEEVLDVKPNSAAPDAQDTWHTVTRRPSAAGKDPRAAMAAVRAQLQVTCIPGTCTCQRNQSTQQSAAITSSVMVYGILEELASGLRSARFPSFHARWCAGQCECSGGGRAAGAHHAAALRG
jgi:hypothetical protein